MDIYIERLLRRARFLGNHHRKYIYFVETHIDKLMARLEQAMVIDQVHLWASARDYKQEMKTIATVGTSLEEKQNDLACYFALQFLQMNLSALDALMLDLTTNPSRYMVYKQFMLRVGHDFRRLTAAYMEQLLDLYLPESYSFEFVFLGVGTRSDQDDIDIGVVDRGAEGRDILNKAISRMNREMFKRAISLHFHLSEHVGSPTSFSASIDEYCALLENEIHDFVIITEMLGAAKILGSRKLFNEFHRKVTFRYNYIPSDTALSKYHEGYLRGIIGEARSFVLRELSRDLLSPKGDGLRMIKAGLYAAKTIFNLRQVNSWAIIQSLKRKDKKRADYYDQIEEPLTFLEIFRYLYQMLIAQEEEIYLDHPAVKDNLAMVAETMGYKSIGAASPTDFLLTDYYKSIRQAKETVKTLLPATITHLSHITIFGKILRHKKVTEAGEKRIGNLAKRFLKEARFFKGTKFWDDIIDVLERKDGRIMIRLANHLSILNPVEKDNVIDDLIEWGQNSFIGMFQFLGLLHKYKERIADPDLFDIVNEKFFNHFRGTSEEAQRWSIVFRHYPKLIHDYISLLSEVQQRKLYKWLNKRFSDRELLPARNRLLFLIKLNYGTSRYFKRVMNRVLGAFPDYLVYLDDPHRLSLIGKGHLAEVERAQSIKQKLQNLVVYYDFEFFRLCLSTLSDTPPQTVAMEFTEFTDTYLRMLFDTCKQEIDDRYETSIKTKDLLGIFVTGGHGHMLAFDDDYDLIILLNSSDSAILDYATKIISRMHTEIVKCGIMPHYRLSDYSGSYICTFLQLRQLLNAPGVDRFVDKSQLLGARMVVGSTVLQQEFVNTFIQPYIYDDRKNYIQELIHDIYERHRSFEKDPPEFINLKEGPGGLRDIEMFLLICRALFKVSEHSNYKLFIQLSTLVPEYAHSFQLFYRNYEFLRKIRDLNRLILSAGDHINVPYIEMLTQNMIVTSPELEHHNLAQHIRNTMSRVVVEIRSLIDKVVIPAISEESFVYTNFHMQHP